MQSKHLPKYTIGPFFKFPLFRSFLLLIFLKITDQELLKQHSSDTLDVVLMDG